jgi:hypothetical protein
MVQADASRIVVSLLRRIIARVKSSANTASNPIIVNSQTVELI